jgi:hypothetical protein
MRDCEYDEYLEDARAMLFCGSLDIRAAALLAGKLRAFAADAAAEGEMTAAIFLRSAADELERRLSED